MIKKRYLADAIPSVFDGADYDHFLERVISDSQKEPVEIVGFNLKIPITLKKNLAVICKFYGVTQTKMIVTLIKKLADYESLKGSFDES